MQEAYRPWHMKYSICCPAEGGYLLPGGVPHLGYPPSDLARVPPHLDLVRVPLQLDLAGVPPVWTWLGYPPSSDLAGVPPHLGLAGVPLWPGGVTPPPPRGQTDGWTDTCQSITFPRTTYAVGKKENKAAKIHYSALISGPPNLGLRGARSWSVKSTLLAIIAINGCPVSQWHLLYKIALRITNSIHANDQTVERAIIASI